MIKTFEDLDVWKRGCQLAVDVCVATNDSKNFGLKDQMQRSALSISSNIAEGAERGSTADYIRFLYYSKGSCGELRTQLYVSQRMHAALQMAPFEKTAQMIQETKEISAMLQCLINTLKAKK